MNATVLKVLQEITAQYGEGVLGDAARLKALLSDFAKDEPRPLHIAFGRCIEGGAYTALKTAADAAERGTRKGSIARRVRDEHGIDTAFFAEALDLLEAALFGTVSAPMPAAEQAPDWLRYTKNRRGMTITRYTGTAVAVVIPDRIKGLRVTEIGDEAFFWCDGLRSVTIPNGVTVIGDRTFMKCSDLTSITVDTGNTTYTKR